MSNNLFKIPLSTGTFKLLPISWQSTERQGICLDFDHSKFNRKMCGSSWDVHWDEEGAGSQGQCNPLDKIKAASAFRCHFQVCGRKGKQFPDIFLYPLWLSEMSPAS